MQSFSWEIYVDFVIFGGDWGWRGLDGLARLGRLGETRAAWRGSGDLERLEFMAAVSE